MKLELVCASGANVKSGYLYNKAWQRADLGKKTIILVPEQYTLEAEKNLLAIKAHSQGMIKIQVMSIKRLMSWIFSGIKNPSATILDETGKTLLIKSILRKHKDELMLFDRAADMAGFSSSVGDFIGDLKKFNVASDDLVNSVTDQESDSSIYKKAHDISKIMAYYQSAEKDINAMDSDDSIDMLCEIIDEGSDELKAFFKDTSIFIDSFDYIPAKNIQLIFSLLPYADSMSVSITVDKMRNERLYAAGINSIESIENAAQSQGIEVDYKQLTETYKNKDEGIFHLEKYLNEYPYRELGKNCNVNITKALGINEEVEYTAASILKLVGKKTFKWNEINVVCSSLDRYSSYISRIFKAYNIPCFLDERRTVTSHPVVVWLLSAMQFSQTHIREHFLNMIKTLYTPINHDECESIEDYLIACSIQGDMFTRDFRRGAKIYNLNKMNVMRKSVMATIQNFDTAKKNTAGWAKEIYKLLEDAKILDIITKERSRLEKEGRLDEAAETGQSWNVIIKVLDQLHTISLDDVMELDDIISLLEESFLNVQIGVLPTGVNNVIIGDVGRSKMSNIKCSFILGANEGQLPIPMPEGTIFTDNELEVFKQNGVSAGRDADFRKSESNYNLYNAIITPTEMLNISYDCSEGRESALVVRKIKNLLPNVITESAHIDPLSSPAAAFSASAKALGAIGDSRPYPSGAWKEGIAALMQEEAYAKHIDKMYNFAAGGSTNYEIMQSVDNNLVASISQLEQYAKCPFAYMISYGLHPGDDPTAQIEHVSSGAYLHKVMEEFGLELMDKDIDKLSDKELDMMMQKQAKGIAKVFEDGAFMLDAKREFLAGQLIETARRSGQVYIKGIKNSDFVPVAHEMTFDIGRELGPIELDLPNGKKVLLRGKIDRVDEYTLGSEKWIRAVDYKSGKKSVDLSGLMTGENLQLFIYANALTEKNTDRPAGVFYFPLRNDYTDEDKDRSDAEKLNGLFVDNSNVVNALDNSIDAGQKSEIVNLSYKNDKTPRKSKYIKTPQYFDAALKASINTAKNLCNMMDEGRMDVNPITDKNTSACAYCDYQNICRFGAQVYDQNQKPTDEQVESYIKGFEGGGENEMD